MADQGTYYQVGLFFTVYLFDVCVSVDYCVTQRIFRYLRQHCVSLLSRQIWRVVRKVIDLLLEGWWKRQLTIVLGFWQLAPKTEKVYICSAYGLKHFLWVYIIQELLFFDLGIHFLSNTSLSSVVMCPNVQENRFVCDCDWVWTVTHSLAPASMVQKQAPCFLYQGLSIFKL